MTKFIIYKDIAGRFRWRLIAANGEKVAASEAYTTRTAAEDSARKVVKWSSTATIEHRY